MTNKNQLRVAVYSLLTGACFFVLASIQPVESSSARVQRIYEAIEKQTGLRGRIPPISVENNNVVNAYNTGTAIVIYQGIIDACQNDDQLALVIGHEIAHTTLMHFTLPYGVDVNNTSIMEAQADKMGAFYVLKAGWDVCKARQYWNNQISVYGDYIGGDHPNYAYRYQQLDVGCWP